MHSFTALLLFLTPTLLAAPAPQDPAPTPKGKITHLYICTDEKFSGTCTNLWLEVSQCHNIQPPYTHEVSSAGPDEGTFCTLYPNNDCQISPEDQDGALPFTHPGIRQLSHYEFDNMLGSVRCDFIKGWHKPSKKVS